MEMQHNLAHRFLALISLLLVCVMLFASCAPTINEVVGTSKATESTDHDHTEHESETDHNHNHGDETDHVHQWSDWVVTKKATCTEDGEETKSCPCGEKAIKIVDALGHDYISVTTAPTCTEQGYTTHTCDVCKDSYVDNYINADGHDYTVVVTDPTCTEKGYTTYTCECGDSYIDNYVNATDHSFGDWTTTKEATCTEKGEKKRECACGEVETEAIPATGHSYKSVVTKPTCTAKGYTTYTCACGDSYIDNYVSATGHSFGEWKTTKDATCTEKGEQRRECACGVYETKVIPATDHSYKFVVTEPTCEDKGYTTYTCHCGDSYVDDYVDANGHSYKSVITAPTCTERGYTTHTCHCGDSYIDTYVDAKNHIDDGTGVCSVCGSACDHFHNFSLKTATDKYLASKATCTTSAKYYYSCTCGEAGTETFNSGDALGHTYTPVVTAPTCTEDGYTTHSCHCGDSYIDDYVDASGHSYTSIVTAPTCTERGYTTHTCHCGDTYADTYIDTISHTDNGFGICSVCGNECDHFHTYKIENTDSKYLASKATCTAPATYFYSCTCGAIGAEVFEYGDALGHTYTSLVTDPTCTEQGYTTYTCHCGYSYVSDEVDALGHDEISHNAKAPTCTEIGWNAYVTCSRCNYTTYEELEALGHDEIEHNAKAPTCTEIGWNAYVTCSRCDYTTYEELKALNHNEIDHNAKAPTCTEIGWNSYVTCSRCDYTTYKELDKLGHDFYTQVTPQTCTSNGYSYNRCSNCDYETMKVIYATGHIITDYYTYDEPTCTADGSYSGYCDNCDEYIEGTLDATGHTASEFYFADDYCGEQKLGYILCVNCEILITEFGHSYKENTVKATCTENGKKIYTCEHCNDSYEQSISSTGHIPGEWTTITPAGCTTIGERGRYCVTCNTLIESVEIAAIGHAYESKTTTGGVTYTCVNCSDSYFVETIEYITITFICDGEEICKALQITKGSTPMLPIPSRDNYSFDGWYLDAAMKDKCLDTYLFTADTTLYATWAKDSISNEANTNNLITNAPIDFTFAVTSDIALTNENLSQYIFVTDLNEKSPKLYIVSEVNGIYTIGSNQYKNGMTYQALLREGATFTDVVGQELWFMIEEDNKSVIDYRDGVLFIPESSVYAGFEDKDKFFIMIQEDILNAGDNAVIYGTDIYDILLIIKVVAEGTFENLFVYQIEIPEFDSIFSEYDSYYSGSLDLQNMEFTEDFTEQLTEQVLQSPMYAQFTYAARRLAGTVIKDYYYDFNGLRVMPSYGIYNNTLIISIEIIAEFARMHVDTREVESLFFVTLDFRNQMSFGVNTQLSAIDNFAFVVSVNSTTSINLFASSLIDSTGKVKKELSYFKIFYEDAQQSGKFSAIDANAASTSHEVKIGELPPLNIAGFTFTLTLTNEFKFEAAGKIGVGIEINTVNELGIKCTPQQGFSTIKSAKFDSRLSLYVMGKIEVSDEIKLTLKVSILGIVNVYGSVSLEPYYIIAGMMSASFSPSSGLTALMAGYKEYGIKSNVKIGADAKITWWWFGMHTATLFKVEWTLYEDKWVWDISGSRTVPLYFNISNEMLSINYDCGSPIDLSTVVNTSVMMQDLSDMITYHATPNCEYYLNGSYAGVSLTESGVLTVNRDIQGEVISVKIEHGDIYKIVNITLNVVHSHVNVEYLEPTCTTEGNTEYVYCDSCDMLLEGENTVLDALGHSYTYIVTAPTCNEDGYTTYTCSRCSDSFRDDYVNTQGHDYRSVVTAPTCTEDGYTTYTCRHCSDSYRDNYVNAQGHNYRSVVTYPTCTERGYTTHICQNCSDSYVDTYVSVVDHIDNGQGTCSVCGGSCDHIHSYIVQNTDPKYFAAQATCTVSETYYYSCTCGVAGVETFESGGALGHTFVNDSAVCDICNVACGLYDADGNMIASWDELVNTYGMNVTKSYSSSDILLDDASPYRVFRNNEVLASGVELIIGNTESIGSWAFSECSHLTSIVLPAGVTSIGYSAFGRCNNLVNIVIPSSVTSIGGSAFSGKITSIVIPNGVETIEDFLFDCCDNLTSVTIGSGVKSIGEHAFYLCSNLKNITIPDNVSSIGSGAFWNCYNLTNVFFSEDSQLTEISENAFYNCYTLESITIPDNVITIGEDAFWKCTNLKTVTIGENVQSLGDDAFYNCDNLEYLYFNATEMNDFEYNHYVFAFAGQNHAGIKLIVGANVKKIPANMFAAVANSPKVYSVYFDDNSICNEIGDSAFEMQGDLISVNLPTSLTYIGIAAFFGTGIKTITLPDGIATIEDLTFNYCTNLMTVNIPNTVTTIGMGAFEECTSLTNITIPDSVTSIGEYAFADCSSLTTVTIPKNVTTLREFTFYGCVGLSSIIIPDSVTNIGLGVLAGCENLESITLPFLGNTIDSTENAYLGYIFGDGYVPVKSVVITGDISSIPDYAFSQFGDLTTIILPDSVTEIGNYAFEFCVSLTNIKIPENVTRIGDYAFYCCTKLTSIIIPNSITSIGDYAFDNCKGLQSITVPNSVTYIGNGAFSYCESLNSITISNSVEYIGDDAFAYSENLNNITFEGTIAEWNSITFGASWNDWVPAQKVICSDGTVTLWE